MKRMKRILMGVGCLAVLLVSWVVTLTAKTDTDRQIELLEKANAYLEDEVYILAMPLLEEAVGYNTEHTSYAEETLKKVYLALNDSKYEREYVAMLDMQMSREGAGEEVFLEAAQYYLSVGDDELLFSVLHDGIKKTNSAKLIDLYESTRYRYSMGRTAYHDVTAVYNGAIQVMLDGFWGLAQSSGSCVIPCEYDKVSTFSDGQAIVKKDGVIYAINSENYRVALYRGEATDFANYAEDRIGMKYDTGWGLVNSNFYTGGSQIEDLGMFAYGYAPAKLNGKWGLLSTDGETWGIQPEYDDVIRDKLGRAVYENTVFVRKGDQVYLRVGSDQVGDVYEDARPFAGGWAAVKKNGKWGFIDAQGAVKIDFRFDDALSFGGHLAAVKVGHNWGYISLSGDMVIEPAFEEAESFYNGSAPVKTADGWRFITLLEYK